MIAALVLCLMGGAAPAPAGPYLPPRKAALDVSGDTVLVVQSFPFTVTAPAGGKLYRWTVPAGVGYSKTANLITVTTAPAGPLKITADWATFTVDKATLEVNVAEFSSDVTVIVGGLLATPKAAKATPTADCNCKDCKCGTCECAAKKKAPARAPTPAAPTTYTPTIYFGGSSAYYGPPPAAWYTSPQAFPLGAYGGPACGVGG